MSYIQPESDVQFFCDLRIDKDHQDTMFFDTVQSKDSYFTALDPVYKVGSVHRCYYVRENRGVIRVELPMSVMIKAEYMRFKNNQFENKWWYAFVDKVNYVNNNTTEVEFTIDHIMTWMGEFTLNDCYVERQHSLTDVVGDNIVDEGLNLGEYVINDRKRMSVQTTHVRFTRPEYWEYLISVAPGNGSVPYDHGGLYSGFAFESVTDIRNITALDEKIDELVTNPVIPWVAGTEIIQGIQIVPTRFSPSQYWDNTSPYFQQHGPYEYEADYVKSFIDIDGYIPKNQKLFTYPYNFLRITNSEGDEHIYKYEMFDRGNLSNLSNTAKFKMIGSAGVKTEIALVPFDYKVKPDIVDPDNPIPCYEEQITMLNFPQVAWSIDTFKAYLAQYLSGVAVQTIGIGMQNPWNTISNASNVDIYGLDSAIGSASADALMGGAYGVLAGTAKTALEPVVKASLSASTQPSIVRGRATSDLMTALMDKDFYAFDTSINARSAKMIDDYFTMFGYADKTVHKPNMNARPFFTYVKTVGCKITCACPSDDASEIEGIFDKGVRFWKDHTKIGNYSVDNAIWHRPE